MDRALRDGTVIAPAPDARREVRTGPILLLAGAAHRVPGQIRNGRFSATRGMNGRACVCRIHR